MRINIKNPNLFIKIAHDILPKLKLNEINGITSDSRLVQKGDIFLAMNGENSDGHNYVNSAEKAGASICIVEKKDSINKSTFKVSSTRDLLNSIALKYRKQLNCPIIGITGTNGKTTTKELLAHVLSADRNVMYTRGNYNSTIGVPLSIFEFSTNTDIAIIEMGANKPGEIEYICNFIKPNMGIITNISEAHIEHFESIESIANTKAALFNSLPSHGTAFINKDDNLIHKIPLQCNRMEYSLSKPADFYGQWSAENQILKINKFPIKLNTLSLTMQINTLAVFSIISQLEMDPILARNQIETFNIPTGRGNIINLRDYIIINDSYNANLASTFSGINTLISMSSNSRKIAVIGDMLELGEMGKKHHQSLGKHLTDKKVDAVFAFGDLTSYTIDAMNGTNIFHQFYEDKDILINDLINFVKKNDIIYIKGSRGMKMEEVIQGLQN